MQNDKLCVKAMQTDKRSIEMLGVIILSRIFILINLMPLTIYINDSKRDRISERENSNG